MKILPRLVLALAPVAAIAAVVTPAQAGNSDSVIGGRYRSRSYESPQNFAFELRFGPYLPKIDDDFPASKPFQSVFGDDHRVYIGVEVDWQALRIPMLGTLGPGVGWGYTHFGATANLTSTGQPSGEQTSLAIMPMYGVGVLRIDVLAREVGIPLVPYGKAGIGYGLWWSSTDLGVTSRDGVSAKGHSWGTHFAAGLMLLLDNFDRHAAAELDNDVGINNSYFFAELVSSRLGGFGSSDVTSLNVGTNTWVMGLALEM